MVDSAPNIRNKQSQGKERGAFVAMLRGYWRIIVAVIGLILIGANEPPKQAAPVEATKEQREISESLKDIAATLKRPNEPDQTTKPCDPKKPDRSSELCAQWKAADSAAEAANWSWGQMLLSGLGALGLGLTLFFNFRALRLAERESEGTRGALEIASRNAEAAQKLADTAKHTAECQLRAYVFHDTHFFDRIWSEDKRSIVGWTIRNTWRNAGKTPAKKVLLHRNLVGFVKCSDFDETLADYDFEDFGTVFKSPLEVGPDTTSSHADLALDMKLLARVKDDTAAYYVYGWIEYDDVFLGTPRRRSEFCLQILVDGNLADPDCRFRTRRTPGFNGTDENCRYPAKDFGSR